MKKQYAELLLKSLRYALLLVACGFVLSCNKDDVLESGSSKAPLITLDNETGVYIVKIGNSLTISPDVENAQGAEYSWLLDGKLVGTDPSYTFISDVEGEYYIDFSVKTKAGEASEEIRVDVVSLAPPVISFALPEGGLIAEVGHSYELTPDVQNSEDATYEWSLNGEVVSHEASYTFTATAAGDNTLVFKVENGDGSDETRVAVTVVERYPIKVEFLKPTYFASSTDKWVSLGRSICLNPYVEHAKNPTFTWTVDGVAVDGVSDRTFMFTPTEKKSYIVKVTVTDRDESVAAVLTSNVSRSAEVCVSAEVTVTCCEPEGTYKRAFGSNSSASSTKVYSFIPAPGQFINDTRNAGYTGAETTPEAANAYAEKRLNAGLYVSLGGWGGYIVVGFDHSIENNGGYTFNGESFDIAITGNSFANSSEPGIVYVMQDVNGNGLPDDEWYELKGSEYGKVETIQDYAVTYYRPSAPGMRTGWWDNRGNNGFINYLAAYYHNQPYYYPVWITSDSYTLHGVCLKSRLDMVEGVWRNGDFEWGYADNFGKDSNTAEANSEANPKDNFFKIANAVYADGTPANLQYIDFVKIQTGVNVSAPAIGENSTEVFGIKDANMLK